MTTSALELRFRLRRLQRKFQIASQPITLPLVDPTAGPMVLEGIAATCTRDRDRMQLVPGALDPLPQPRNVRLLLRHDPTVIAGTVETLDYDSRGILRVRARVEHAQARRMSAFSVGLRIVACELCDADTENFHGILHKAELSEISITDRPSNPDALVENRIPACFSDFYTNAARGMRAANEILVLMKGQLHAQANPQ